MSQAEIPKIIHQIWTDDDIPAEFRSYCESWRRLNIGWEYRLWTDVEADRFVSRNFPDILPIYRGYPRDIYRADAVRYMILHKLGGLYVDLDFQCLIPISPLLSGYQAVVGVWGKSPTSPERPPVFPFREVPNAFMASVPNHPLMATAIDLLNEHSKAGGPVSATGPQLLKTALARVKGDMGRLGIVVYSKELYPLEPSQMKMHKGPIEPGDLTAVGPEAYAVHWWYTTWRPKKGSRGRGYGRSPSIRLRRPQDK